MVLRVSAALTMLLFGIHQLIRPQSWSLYVPAWVSELSHLSLSSIMRTHAIGNIIIALYLVSGVTALISAWAAFVWWLSVLPFAFLSDWKIAMRDVSVALSLLALIFLLS